MRHILIYFVIFPALLFSLEHSVPIGTKDNQLILTVQNELSYPMTDVFVKVDHHPEWIQFSEEVVVLDSIPAHYRKEAEFTFIVLDGEAGQTGRVSLLIQDRTQKTLKKHALDLKTELSLKETTLFAAYPNPSNPHTTIRYALVEPSQVKLKIYNVLGQHVRTLLGAEKPAGQYHVLWDGTNDRGLPLASGTYIVRLETTAKGRTVFQTSKLLLRK
jgi:hypothetical protein